MLEHKGATYLGRRFQKFHASSDREISPVGTHTPTFWRSYSSKTFLGRVVDVPSQTGRHKFALWWFVSSW